MSAAAILSDLTKASVFWSGEKAGKKSPTDPVGGEVSLVFSPVSIEIETMLKGCCWEFLSGTARSLPSGEQLSVFPITTGRYGKASASLRSAPPNEGTKKTPPSVFDRRRKAI